jgi:hypothetical protein
MRAASKAAFSGRICLSIVFAAVLFCSTLGSQAIATARNRMPSAKARASVRFVGCRSDGQVGPLKAPIGNAKLLPIPESAADRLAYYKAGSGPGVLAPRGWHCFGTYGSNGENLYVYPGTLDIKQFVSENWRGFSGPVVQLGVSIGDTSGRFEVARIIARVFPAYTAFLNKIIDERIEPASDFPRRPFPTDLLYYRGKSTVEYETPAGTDGLGTNSRLLKNHESIRGVAILVGDTPDSWLLAARFRQSPEELIPVIIRQVEREAAALKD